MSGTHSGERTVSLIKGVRKIRYSDTENEISLYLIPNTKINSKWIMT
jgi:hypothetical protein